MSAISQFKLTCDAGRDRSVFDEVSRGFFTCLSWGTSKMMFQTAFWKERSLLMSGRRSCWSRISSHWSFLFASFHEPLFPSGVAPITYPLCALTWAGQRCKLRREPWAQVHCITQLKRTQFQVISHFNLENLSLFFFFLKLFRESRTEIPFEGLLFTAKKKEW